MYTRKFPQWAALVLPLAVFTILRLPMILHQPGGQDEQYFAVPGYTVWTEGIPRIPFYPARERSTLFERSDRCLLAMPPALFYCQAPFHAICPPGYPTARLPAFIAGFIAIVLVYIISRYFHSSPACALIAANLFAISRPIMFTATIARPDLPCVVCGLAAILVWLRWLDHPTNSPWIGMGGLCGLACLFHPLGLVFCIQAGLASLLSKGSFRLRCIRLAWLAASISLILSLWLPLIIQYPEEFRTQFFANIFDRAGPGLPARIVWPFASIVHHSRLVFDFVGPWQCFVYATLVIMGCVTVRRQTHFGLSRVRAIPQSSLKQLLVVVLTSIYLTATVAGIHPMKTYWVYATALIFVLAAVLATELLASHFAKITLVTIVLLLMLPGAGLKTTWIYLRHWGDPAFHAPNFIHGVLKDYPEDGLYLADLSYVYDIYLSGRKTILLRPPTDYGNQIDMECDYIFTAWEGNDAEFADAYGPYAVRHLGSRVPDQACYVDVLVPSKQ